MQVLAIESDANRNFQVATVWAQFHFWSEDSDRGFEAFQLRKLLGHGNSVPFDKFERKQREANQFE